MFQKQLDRDLKAVVKRLGFITPTDTVIYIQENPKFGDYSSNIALQLSKQKHQNTYQTPPEIANAILEQFGHPDYLESISIAGPGFLNFTLKDKSLLTQLTDPKLLKAGTKTGKKYLVEFAQPNTHKAFHIGHLRNISIGESISRLLEYTGHEVFRVTYGGDIGPHVAKAIYGIFKLEEEFESVKTKSLREKAEFLGRAYALGSKAYEESDQTKEEINQINTKLYQKDLSLLPLWEETKLWSIGYFETIYSSLSTEFDEQIWESEIQEVGVDLVKKNIGKIFEEDQGAVIFPGEKYGLHNRVFITSKGYPTYEAKELGLTQREKELFPFDISLHVVATEQAGFFKVVTKAMELMETLNPGSKRHISYGMVNLSSGKMSSRKGDIITAESLIEEVTIALNEQFSGISKTNAQKIATCAIKFFFLKYSFTSDIAFDIEKSVSLNGDSGPYVMYVYARITSLLNRAKDSEANKKSTQAQKEIIAQSLEDSERLLLRQLDYFDIVALKAAENLQPNELTSYLLDLSKAFNFFYEKSPILGSDKQALRLEIIKRVGETIQLGLYLLGIETVERM